MNSKLIFIYLSLSIHISIYHSIIYIYVRIYIHMYIYIHIYIFQSKTGGKDVELRSVKKKRTGGKRISCLKEHEADLFESVI